MPPSMFLRKCDHHFVVVRFPPNVAAVAARLAAATGLPVSAPGQNGEPATKKFKTRWGGAGAPPKMTPAQQAEHERGEFTAIDCSTMLLD